VRSGVSLVSTPPGRRHEWIQSKHFDMNSVQSGRRDGGH
jgi:hypothetical protein